MPQPETNSSLLEEFVEDPRQSAAEILDAEFASFGYGYEYRVHADEDGITRDQEARFWRSFPVLKNGDAGNPVDVADLLFVARPNPKCYPDSKAQNLRYRWFVICDAQLEKPLITFERVKSILNAHPHYQVIFLTANWDLSQLITKLGRTVAVYRDRESPGYMIWPEMDEEEIPFTPSRDADGNEFFPISWYPQSLKKALKW